MTRFRPCIDLHAGRVKQIVGGTLRDESAPKVNFESDQPPAWFSARYRADNLTGGHVIMLGAGNEAAASDALAAWPGGMQVGGGVNAENASLWLERGASHVIVTSWLFDPRGHFLPERLKQLCDAISPERLVIDLSCRRTDSGWTVAMNRWQLLTDLSVTEATLRELSASCAEFLVHAADVEGLCRGIDEDLVALLGKACDRPVTYAGGARSMKDFAAVDRLSGGRVDLTVGSALDLFGGSLIRYQDCLKWNNP